LKSAAVPAARTRPSIPAAAEEPWKWSHPLSSAREEQAPLPASESALQLNNSPQTSLRANDGCAAEPSTTGEAKIEGNVENGPSLKNLEAEQARLDAEIAQHAELIKLTERREQIRKEIERMRNS
jgi:hypothetical protein